MVYMGRPATALYFRDVTQTIIENLLTMQRNEAIQTQQQTESFTSTISHEMKTPILTMIFFVNQVLSMLSGA